MFKNEDERARTLVEVIMTDSRRLKGNMLMPPISSLPRQLNNDNLFLEFEDFDGGLHLIAKQAMAEVIVPPNPKAAKLEAKPLDRRNTPHAELGLQPDATAEQIAQAYPQMLRKYDPANIEGLDLPAEVAVYFTARRENIEAAYKFLTGSEDTKAA